MGLAEPVRPQTIQALTVELENVSPFSEPTSSFDLPSSLFSTGFYTLDSASGPLAFDGEAALLQDWNHSYLNSG